MQARTLVGLIAAAACGLLALAATAQDAAPKDAPKNASLGHVRHVVLLKFKDATKDEDIKKVEAAFRALREKIPVVESLECGTNVSPEKLNEGFTHCFFLTFKTEKDRDTYLTHPEHKAFGSVLGPFKDKVLVVDFVAKD
jgi:hypothetical protein